LNELRSASLAVTTNGAIVPGLAEVKESMGDFDVQGPEIDTATLPVVCSS
jgi:hypothetical protein